MTACCFMRVRLNALNRLLILYLAVSLTGAQAQSLPSPATERTALLQQLLQELRQEREAYYQQKARDEGDIKQAQGNTRVLQAQVDAVRSQQADLDQQLVTLQTETQSLTEQLQRRDDLDRIVTEHITPLVPAQQQAIDRGIPYKRPERLTRLQVCMGDPNEPTVSGVDRLTRLWSYVQEELRLARSSETYTDRVLQPDGSIPYARYLRVGQRILAYMTEDGGQTAVWLRGPGGTHWQSVPDAQQQQVHTAIEILDGRRAPALVTLPVTVQASGAGEMQP
jgi:hypothetical protein